MWPYNGPGGLPTENWTAVWEGYLEFPIATKEKNKSRAEQHGFLILSNVNDAYAMELQDRDGKWIRVNEGSWGGGSSDFAARTGVVPTTDNVSNDQTNGLVRWLDGKVSSVFLKIKNDKDAIWIEMFFLIYILYHR